MRAMFFKPLVAVAVVSVVATTGVTRLSAAEPGSAAGPGATAEPRPATVAQSGDDRLEQLKQEVLAGVDERHGFIQRMVDSQFSFGELGFQEFETQRYLTGILEREGFEIELGTAGMPSAWLARWGSGRPWVALGSDVDGIPRSSQVPGAAYRQPQIEGRPEPRRGAQHPGRR